MARDDDAAFWDRKAHGYDAHTRTSAGMYEKMLGLIERELGADAEVLDVGTGTGEIPLHICGNVRRVEGVDFSPEMIACARRKADERGASNVEFRVQDAGHLTCPDGTFDVVIAANILHVVPDPARLLAEARRVLKDEGKLITPTFVHGESWRTRLISWFLRRAGHPVRTRFDSARLADLVGGSGFRLDRQTLIPNIMPVSFVVAAREPSVRTAQHR